MAGSRIKGITISLDGETKGIQKALGDVNKKSRDLQGELKQVERALKFSPGNADLIAQKYDILAEQVETTSGKLDKLKKAQSEVEQQFKSGKIDGQQFRAFQREIAETESKLNHFKSEANQAFDQIESSGAQKEVGKLKKSFDKAGDAAREMADDAKGAMSGIGAGAGGLAAGVLAGVGEGQDNAKILARLQTSADMKGVDLSIVEEAYKRIVAITGDADSAGETISNLLASGANNDNLLDYVNQVNGAFLTFGGTLQTEGIADGIQESLSTGEAAGSLLELLERAGVDMDDFNKKLGKAKETGDGTKFMLEALAENGYGKMTEKYKEMNPELQKQAEAQTELQTSINNLVESLTPLLTVITNFVTKITEWAEENPKLVETLVKVAGAIALIVGVFAALSPIVTTIMKLWPVLAAVFGAITVPIALVVAGIAVLIGIGVLLWKNWETIKTKAIEIFTAVKTFLIDTWNKIMLTFQTVLNLIDKVTKGKFKSITNAIRVSLKAAEDIIKVVWSFIKETFSNGLEFVKAIVTGDFGKLKSIISNQMKNIKNAISDVWNIVKSTTSTVWNGIKSTISGIVDGIKSTISRVFNGIKSTISGVWESVASSTNRIWDGIVSSIKGAINGVIGAINGMLNAISSISIDLPSLPGWVPGDMGGGSISFPNIPNIPSLDVGTNYVKKDGLAMIHEGEAVVPKRYNPAAGGTNTSIDYEKLGKSMAKHLNFSFNVDGQRFATAVNGTNAVNNLGNYFE